MNKGTKFMAGIKPECLASHKRPAHGRPRLVTLERRHGTKSDTMSEPQDQRAFFRIQDQVVLQVRQVDKQTLEREPPGQLFPQQAQHQLLQEFRRLGQEQHRLLQDVDKLDPSWLRLFKLQERKLDLLASHWLAHSDPELVRQTVTLSEDGIAFESSKTCYRDSFLALSLILPSSNTGLCCFAQVLRCESLDNRHNNQRNQIAAKFLRLSEVERNQLARHIMLRQQQLARAKANRR